MHELTITRDYRGGETERIAVALRQGNVIILPASTIYGISCIYYDKEAVERVYRIKKRLSSMPFIVLISRIRQLDLLVSGVGSLGRKILQKYWQKEDPRPLTLVFRKSTSLPPGITGGRDTVAVRMAGIRAVRNIIDISGPLISTSANLSGQKTDPASIEDIPEEIRSSVDMIVRLKGRLEGRPSTIVDVTGERPSLIREGPLGFDDILEDI